MPTRSRSQADVSVRDPHDGAPVLLLARNRAYAVELLRAGVQVVQPGEADATALDGPWSACVIESAGVWHPEPLDWERISGRLDEEVELPLVAVVSGGFPPWLEPLGHRVRVVAAAEPGADVADWVVAELRPALRALPAPEVVPDEAIDVGLAPDEVVDLAGTLDREAAAGTLAVASRVPPDRRLARSSSVPLRMATLDELADRLGEELDRHPPLGQVGEAVAVELADELHADVAVLAREVADGPWQVVAGVGLRPLEWRPVSGDLIVLGLLDDSHPILNIGSTDDVRQTAAGLPCVSRDHLLVARLPMVQVLVVAGRAGPAFTDGDVLVLSRHLCDDPGYGVALRLRALAERLAPYRDA